MLLTDVGLLEAPKWNSDAMLAVTALLLERMHIL